MGRTGPLPSMSAPERLSAGWTGASARTHAPAAYAMQAIISPDSSRQSMVILPYTGTAPRDIPRIRKKSVSSTARGVTAGTRSPSTSNPPCSPSLITNEKPAAPVASWQSVPLRPDWPAARITLPPLGPSCQAERPIDGPLEGGGNLFEPRRAGIEFWLGHVSSSPSDRRSTVVIPLPGMDEALTQAYESREGAPSSSSGRPGRGLGGARSARGPRKFVFLLAAEPGRVVNHHHRTLSTPRPDYPPLAVGRQRRGFAGGRGIEGSEMMFISHPISPHRIFPWLDLAHLHGEGEGS